LVNLYCRLLARLRKGAVNNFGRWTFLSFMSRSTGILLVLLRRVGRAASINTKVIPQSQVTNSSSPLVAEMICRNDAWVWGEILTVYFFVFDRIRRGGGNLPPDDVDPAERSCRTEQRT
jgi:hypothetical protein